MADEILTPERILAAAEDVLRRFGPAKATVVDVARALGVSHGSVYRHFPSKAALRDAVVERWLVRMVSPLAAVVDEDAPAAERLRRWLETLIAAKRRRAAEESELFATYVVLFAESSHAIGEHLGLLAEQIERIIADGVARGEFAPTDPATTARAVFDATTRFHNPIHAAEWSRPDVDDAFDRVWSLILNGLRA